eukprot:1377047-Rhodomonas_salina.1
MLLPEARARVSSRAAFEVCVRLRGWAPGCRVQGPGSRVQGPGSRVQAAASLASGACAAARLRG